MLDGGDSILLLTITDIRGKGEENIFLPPKPVYHSTSLFIEYEFSFRGVGAGNSSCSIESVGMGNI